MNLFYARQFESIPMNELAYSGSPRKSSQVKDNTLNISLRKQHHRHDNDSPNPSMNNQYCHEFWFHSSINYRCKFTNIHDWEHVNFYLHTPYIFLKRQHYILFIIHSLHQFHSKLTKADQLQNTMKKIHILLDG